MNPFGSVAFRIWFAAGVMRMPIMCQGAPRDLSAAEAEDLLDMERQITFQSWEAES